MEGPVWAAIVTGAFGFTVYFVKKESEKKSVSTAVLAEIQRLLKVLVEHRSHWERWMKDNETHKHPLIPFSFDVYQKHVDNLGFIKAKHVGSVVQFYGYLNFVNSLQGIRAQYKKDRAAFDGLYKAALVRITNEYGQAFDSAFREYGLT